MGKTVVLKEFLRRHLETDPGGDCCLAYMDLPRLVLTPEGFAVQYIGYLLYWLAGDLHRRVESFFRRSSPTGRQWADGCRIQ